MPDENTDQNTTQPPYRLTMCFSVISSLIPEQGIHDEFAVGFKVSSVTECGFKAGPNQENFAWKMDQTHVQVGMKTQTTPHINLQLPFHWAFI